MPRNKHTTITGQQLAARQENARKATEARKALAAERREKAAASLSKAGVPAIDVSLARREAARAELAELELGQKRGELVAVADVAAKFVEVVTVAKVKLLALATRCRQRMPHLTPADVQTIDDLVREALENLADGKEADDAR